MTTRTMCLKEAVKKLGPMISERRKARIASVVASRTSTLALLMENVKNEANESAVLRSMDALGVPHLHKLQTTPADTHTDWHSKKKRRFPPRTDSGARNWVEIHHWSDTKECISHLKTHQGFVVASACPDAPISVTNVDFSQKLLVAFGNEVDGISDELAELSDFKFSLPMCGFVESFNISVSVALTLYHAYLHRIKANVRKTEDTFGVHYIESHHCITAHRR